VQEQRSRWEGVHLEKVILLVEDNPDDEMLALRAFTKSNIANRVVVARDGVEALDYIFATGPHEGRDISGQEELILLDLHLPRVDGFEVLRRLKADARTKSHSVVIMTSSREGPDIIKSYELGANNFIRKPVEFAQLIEAVRQLGLYWQLLDEDPHTTERPPSVFEPNPAGGSIAS